jgi:hypothetical protein
MDGMDFWDCQIKYALAIALVALYFFMQNSLFLSITITYLYHGSKN